MSTRSLPAFAAGVVTCVVGLGACGGGGGGEEASTRVVTENGVIIAGSEVVLRPEEPADAGALQKAKEILENRLRQTGVKTFTVDVRDGNLVVAIAAGDKQITPALGVVAQRGQLLMRPVLRTLPAGPAGGAAAPATTTRDDPAANVVLPATDGSASYELGPAMVSGADITTAKPEREEVTGTWIIEFTLTPQGTAAFNDLARATGVGNQIAIDYDGEVVAAPTLRSTTFEDEGHIAANFTQQEAKDLAVVISSGALPFAVEAQPVTPFAGRS